MQHLELTLIAVGIGFAFALPLALIAHRYGKFEQPIGILSALLYTFPSFALFQILVPFTGITTTTVEIALVSYTLVILFPNIVAGLRSAPADVIEAARGMGLTRRQVLWRVELPLAIPAIVGGLRVAVVSTIAIATIAATLLPKGLGFPILLALKYPTPFKTEIYTAGLLAVALALGADLLLVALRRVLVPWERRSTWTMLLGDVANFHTFVDGFRFIGDHPGFLLTKAWEQIELSAAALGLAVLIALPIGVLLGHYHRLSTVAIGASIFGRGIPSLVLIAAFLTILGIGFWNNMVALAVLGSGPVLTNAYLAIDTVDRDTVEAARGMGVHRSPDPWAQGELPTWNSPALCGYSHRSSHDRRHRPDRRVRRRGRARRHHRQPGELSSCRCFGSRVLRDAPLGGSVFSPSSVATRCNAQGSPAHCRQRLVLLKGAVVIRKHTRRAAKAAFAISLGVAIVIGVYAAAFTQPAHATTKAGPTIILGTKNFPEQYILGELYKQALEAKGFTVSYKENIGSTELMTTALQSGKINFYPEYTGVIVQDVFHKTNSPKTASATYACLQRSSRPRRGTRCSTRRPSMTPTSSR